MNLKSVCATVTAAIALLMPQAVFMQKTADAGEFIAKERAGLINWSAGYLEATGKAVIKAEKMTQSLEKASIAEKDQCQTGRRP